MTRKEQIRQASKGFLKEHFQNDLYAFVTGAEWSDENPDYENESAIMKSLREKIQQLSDELQALKAKAK